MLTGFEVEEGTDILDARFLVKGVEAALNRVA